MQIATEVLYMSSRSGDMQQFSRTTQLPPRVPITPSSRSSNKSMKLKPELQSNLPAGFKSKRRSIDLSLEINSLRHTAEDTSIGSLRGVFDTPRRRTPKLALTRADYAIPNTYTRAKWKKRDMLPIRLTKIEDKVQYNIKSPQILQQHQCEYCSKNRSLTVSNQNSQTSALLSSSEYDVSSSAADEGGFTTANLGRYSDLNRALACGFCGRRASKSSQEYLLSHPLPDVIMQEDKGPPRRESWTSHNILPSIHRHRPAASPPQLSVTDDKRLDEKENSLPPASAATSTVSAGSCSTRWSSPEPDSQSERSNSGSKSPETLVSIHSPNIDESAEEAAIHVEKPSKVRVRETKPIQMSKVLLERHKTQLKNKSQLPNHPLVDELMKTKDKEKFEEKFLERFNKLAESLDEAESEADNDNSNHKP